MPAFRTILCAALAIALTGAPYAAIDPEAPSPQAVAKRLLSKTGVTGGLVVHIGCGDGRLTTALRASDAFVVHGLDTDPDNIAKARAHVFSQNLYGDVSIHLWRGERLPYADNLVRLLVVEQPRSVTNREIHRVLAPGGVACLKEPANWAEFHKTVPNTVDDWQHCLYDASNNAVAKDERVGPPYHMRWVAAPRHTRHHERLASISVVVSAGGRLFYIEDQAPAASILLRPDWKLVARDAYTGIMLWKRDIKRWEPHLRGFRSGPPEISRRLVATDDTVYATLGYGTPVTALDPATGRTIRDYDNTVGTEEIRYRDGMLYLVINPSEPDAQSGAGEPEIKAIAAIDATTGRTLWETTDYRPMATTLAISDARAFFFDTDGVVCLDARTGDELWRSPRQVTLNRPGWSAPTLVAHDGVVLCADRTAGEIDNYDPKRGRNIAGWLAQGGVNGQLTALSAETGEKLWSCTCAEGFHAPVDVFVVDDLVWVGQSRARQGPDFNEARDLHTGNVKRRIDTDRLWKTTMAHHRCHRNRATSRYIITGRTGIEFIDTGLGTCLRNHWVRGTCQFGFLPCNGLIYAPPHSCACYILGKLAGFYALAPQRKQPAREPYPQGTAGRLARGPAYRDVPLDAAPTQSSSDPEWPTYRHDVRRSGATTASVPANLRPIWSKKLGDRITSPVVSQGKALIASIDAHTLYALDARTGKPLWRFTADGRIDSPPAISSGRVVFGSADGHVYCLRGSDGKLAWRFRAAPQERLIVAHQQLESVWPVHGNVLVQHDQVYFAAGRSSFLDGGIRLYRLDLATGQELAQHTIYSRDPKTGRQPEEPMAFEMPGAKPDILSSDGDLLYMRERAFDLKTLEPRETQPHLFSPAGFLTDDWWHRNYWIYGKHFYSGYIGWFFAGREAPGGRALAFDNNSIYGYSYVPRDYRGATGRKYHLFATNRQDQPNQPKADYRRAQRDYRQHKPPKFNVGFRWTRDVPLLGRAMLLADDTLFIAGPPDRGLRSRPIYEGKRGAILQAIAAENGESLAKFSLNSLPAHDGMAAAYGRLYLATTDGKLLCMGGPDQPGAKQIGKNTFLTKPPSERREVTGEPTEPGLVGHYTLDDPEEQIALDSSGLGNDGEVYGAWVKGDFGTCLHMDGTPGALTLPDGPYLHFGNSDFTIEFWGKPDRYDTRIMGKEAFPEKWWVLNLLDNGRVEMVLGQTREEGKMVRPTTNAPLPGDQWTHLAFVVDRTNFEVRAFINGQLDSTTDIPKTLDGSLSVKGTDLRIPSAHKPFSGLFDELRIYKRALTAEEINGHYANEKDNRSGVNYEKMW